MATPRIVDPTQFILLASVTDWTTVFRRQHGERQPKQIMVERKLELARLVQLRWITAPGLGYPTEPFRVWRRPALPMQGEHELDHSQVTLFTLRMVALEKPAVFVRLQLNASAAGALIAFAGMPYASAVVAVRPLSAGFNEVAVSGPAIQAFTFTQGTAVQRITGLHAEVAADPSWELMEVVGLPVGPEWSGVLELDQKQGLVANLGEPRDAALDRFRRGAPFYGWEPNIPGGSGAPPWKLADPVAMLKVMDAHMLPPLRDMVTSRPPAQHAGFEVQHTLPPVDPMNPAQPGDDALARFKPMQQLVFGASTDPLASLVSGYGTAFEDTDLPPIVLGDRKLFGDPSRSDWDFMVTARYARGADGQSDAVEYAALIFAPGVGSSPAVPAAVAVENQGLRAPPATDADWRAIQNIGWDKIPDALPFRVGSYALARQALGPAGPVVPLMGKRPLDDALQPISATGSAEQDKTGRLAALDETWALATVPDPNVLLYALAHQDLFGLWSGWASASASVAEPPVQPVSLLSARIDAQAAPAGSPCPGTLVLELAWDWASRSPRRIEIVGRMYGQAKLGDAPPAGGPPPALQTRLGPGPAGVLQLDFSGSASATVLTGVAGLAGSVEYLSQDGKTLLSAPPTHAGPRRYRVTLPGLLLDHDAAPFIGLALWARGVEQRAPNRTGAWSPQPLLASRADPRPPVIVIERENVQLASIGDARGEHHAQLEWPAAAGAIGYFVYTTTETKLRADRNLGVPARSATLAERLVALRDAFGNDPDRRSFTRVNAQPIAGTALQVTLPRGSKEIHLYVVMGVSAGQVESAWPAPAAGGTPAWALLRKRPIAFAAPQIARPAPPDLEVGRVLDEGSSPPAWRAAVRARAKPGATVVRMDLYRVRVADAAVELDTMGPPLVQLTGSSAPWTVTPLVSPVLGETQAFGVVQGLDPVPGSWRRVFYRAVAWAGDDLPRGIYGARSAPSAVREVVVPPSGPPDLAPLNWHWPGGDLGDVQVESSTLAPFATTPLGDHRLRVDVRAGLAAGGTALLLQHPPAPGGADTLQAMPTVPPAAGTAGLWRSSAAGVTTLHLRVRRASVDDTVQVRLLLSDPLGRATERVLTVPAGSPLPEPDIISPQVTPRPGVGFILRFGTTVPVAPLPGGVYRLLVRHTPPRPLPLPLPVPPGPAVRVPTPPPETGFPRPVFPPVLDPRRQPAPSRPELRTPDIDRLDLEPVRPPIGPLPRVQTLDIALPEIPPAEGSPDIFSGSVPIPVRRGPGPMRQTLIAVGIRGRGGRVELAIVAPDGRRASVQLDLG